MFSASRVAHRRRCIPRRSGGARAPRYRVTALAVAIRQSHNLELSPWIGLHTGPAIVEMKEDKVTMVGDVRNVGLRLKKVIEPAQVCCSEATFRLIQSRFRFTELGDRTIAGVARPVLLFRVEHLASPGSGFEPPTSTGLSPLTGRDLEINLLKDRWDQAREGTGQVVMLVGEPGLGKSRLIHTLKEHVLGEKVEGEVDAPVIEWRCSPHFQNSALYPAIDFYERALGVRPEEPAQDRFDRLLRRLEQYGLARPEVVPLWATLLSLPIPDRFPLSLPPARQREETFRLLLEWLQVRTARGPVLFVVEDLHWVDASTLEFLGQVLAEVLHNRILILLTFRPEFKPPWATADRQTTLALTRLTRRQVGDWMRKKVTGTLSDVVIEEMYDRTGGVPLFVEEFAKMLQESAEPAGAGGVHGPGTFGHEIPSTLQDLVMARLDRLEGGRELAQLAAVLGREFSHEVLAAVAAVDEPTLHADLAELARAEILYAKGRPPRCTYVFKHALLEDALYNALVKGKRQQFHQRIGEVLEQQFPQTAEIQPEVLGYHFTEANLVEKAVGYWLNAGRRSRERSAVFESDRPPIERLSRTGRRSLRGVADPRRLGIAVPHHVGPHLHCGPRLCRARSRSGTGSCRRLMPNDRRDRQQQFGIMLGMWEWRLVRGDLRACVDLAAEGIAFAESRQDPGMLMEALFMPGATMFYRGQFAGARNSVTRTHWRTTTTASVRNSWSAYSGHDAGVKRTVAISHWTSLAPRLPRTRHSNLPVRPVHWLVRSVIGSASATP